MNQLVKPEDDFSKELSNSLSAFHFKMLVSEITYSLALVLSV